MTQEGAADYDCYVYFVPQNITGETADDVLKKKKALDIKKFEIQVENQTNIGSAGGQGGKVRFEKCTLEKPTDASTTLFFKNCANAFTFDECVLIMRKNTKPFMEVKLLQAVISGITMSGEGNEESSDSIIIDYGAIEMTYYKQDANGDFQPVSEAKWSRIENAET